MKTYIAFIHKAIPWKRRIILIEKVKVELIENPFDPWEWVKSYQEVHADLKHKYGATSVFIGTMRDFNQDNSVQSMTLEHYPGMTEKHLNALGSTAMQKWDIIDICIAHRIGKIYPGDAIVCVAVWSIHRKEAYESNRMVMEDLKSKTPFWKKEQLQESARWVEKNTEGF